MITNKAYEKVLVVESNPMTYVLYTDWHVPPYLGAAFPLSMRAVM